MPSLPQQCPTVNDEVIETTPGHPFYVAGRGWVEAQALNIGDTLLTSKGNEVIVHSVTIASLETPVTVYNFEVEDFHTYFVSIDSVLVHNTCGPQGSLKLSNDSYLKDLGYDPHEIKIDALGTNKHIARYDIYQDSQGTLWVLRKGGIGTPIPTYINIR